MATIFSGELKGFTNYLLRSTSVAALVLLRKLTRSEYEAVVSRSAFYLGLSMS